MNFFSRLFKRDSGQGPRGPLSLTQYEEMLERGYLGLDKTSTGVPVTEITAQNHAAVYAAVYIISTQFACLPCWPYERLEPLGKKRLSGDLARLLHDEPNPLMTQQVMSETMAAHMLLFGNAFAEIERDNDGNPLALWLLTPDRVKPKFMGEDLVYQVDPPPGQSGEPAFIPAADMLHVPYLGFNGIEGKGVIAYARETIGVGLAAGQFIGQYFENGAKIGGFVEDPNNIVKPEQVEKVKKLIREQHTGLKQAWRTAFLPHGLTYKGIPFNAKDAEFLALRAYTDLEVCRFFNIQPTKIKDTSHATYSNNEQENIAFGKDTLRPIVNRFKQEYKRKLVKQADKDRIDIDFIFADLERADTTTRWATYGIGLQYGVLSPDEVRDNENLPPRPDGKGGEYVVAQNIVGKQQPAEEPPADGQDKQDPPAEDVPSRAIAAAKEMIAVETERFRQIETDRLPRLDTDQKRADFYASFTDKLRQALTPAYTILATLTGSDMTGIQLASEHANAYQKATQ